MNEVRKDGLASWGFVLQLGGELHSCLLRLAAIAGWGGKCSCVSAEQDAGERLVLLGNISRHIFT